MRLNELFNDGIIFQANKPIRIFGSGGGKLKIEFCENTVNTETVGTDWEVEFPPMHYGGPYEMTVNLDGRIRVLKDIYIGDVYIIAGQSNMQFKLHESDCSKELYKTDELLRLFSTERLEGGEKFFPQDGWVKAQKDSVGDWSALGYMTAMLLREKTNHAIGLITCYQGAAAIQSFLHEEFFENPSFNIPFSERFDNQYFWNKGHSLLFNYQTQKIAPISSAGVIWYQGESNASEKESQIYEEMLSALIHSWRKAFRDNELPFVIIQIADCAERDNEYWHTIQFVQEKIQHTESNVKTVICRDICENTDIHPKRKYELAERIANALFEV